MSRRIDPVAALVTKRFAMWDATEAYLDGEDEDAFTARVGRACAATRRLDRRIVSTVATTPEGLIAQVRLLAVSMLSVHVIGAGGGNDDMRVQLGETVIAGIRALIGDGR